MDIYRKDTGELILCPFCNSIEFTDITNLYAGVPPGKACCISCGMSSGYTMDGEPIDVAPRRLGSLSLWELRVRHVVESE